MLFLHVSTQSQQTKGSNLRLADDAGVPVAQRDHGANFVSGLPDKTSPSPDRRRFDNRHAQRIRQ